MLAITASSMHTYNDMHALVVVVVRMLNLRSTHIVLLLIPTYYNTPVSQQQQ